MKYEARAWPGFLEALQNANKAQLAFLRIEVEAAFAFAGRALVTGDPVVRNRNRRKARLGCDTVLHFLAKTVRDPSQPEEIDEDLKRLKAELRQLGERI